MRNDDVDDDYMKNEEEEEKEDEVDEDYMNNGDGNDHKNYYNLMMMKII